MLPCLAEEWGDSIAVTASVGGRDSSTNQYYHGTFPFSGRTIFYTSDAATFRQQPLTVKSALYAPVEYDRTMILSIGIQNNTAGSDSWFNGVEQYANLPSVYYADSRMDGSETSGLVEYQNGVQEANDVYEVYGEAGEIFNFQVVIPAYSNSFEFSTTDFVIFTTEASPWHIVSYGGYIIETADESVLGVIEQILSNTQSIDTDVSNILSAVNSILLQLQEIGADTDTICSLLGGLTDLGQRQLNTLQAISENVDAIYYFLTQEMAEEADATNKSVTDSVKQIDKEHGQQEFHQEEMEYYYEELALREFSFGNISGGMQLCGAIFGSFWSALGSKLEYAYTVPLALGIGLLLIGKLARSDKKETSESSNSNSTDIAVRK